MSGHQRPGGAVIDWHEVKTDGQSFAIIKATEGSDWVNRYAVEDVEKAANAGLKVGAYHYARPAKDARVQARHFATQLSKLPASSLPPVLDLEVNEGKTPQQLIAWTRDFLDELEKNTGGTKPMVYTYPYFWLQQMANTKEFSDYPLWLAAYQNQAPKPVGGWDELAMWQRTGSGRVGGITGQVDMNVFNGTAGQLAQFNYGGGHLDGLTVRQGPSLGSEADELIDALLEFRPDIFAAAENAGIDADVARELAKLVGTLAVKGELPVTELEKMARSKATVSDLVIFLDNAAR